MGHAYNSVLRKSLIKRRPNGGTDKRGNKVAGWNVQQFGQPSDASTNYGATGCTDTCLQWMVYVWKGYKVTQDRIRYVARANKSVPIPRTRGLYPSEVQRVLNYYLPGKYVVVLGESAQTIRKAAKRAPVLFGHHYYYWPDWYKYRLGGTASDGRPNGYASPRGAAGKTQSTWSGAHAGVLLGTAEGTDGDSDLVYAFEPNHGSAARPEKPAYDVMTEAQFDAVYESYRLLGRDLYAVIPRDGVSLPAGSF